MPLVSVSTVYLPLASAASVVKIAIESAWPLSIAEYCDPVFSGLKVKLFSPYACLQTDDALEARRVLGRAEVGEVADVLQVVDRLQVVRLSRSSFVHRDTVGVLERRRVEDVVTRACSRTSSRRRR